MRKPKESKSVRSFFPEIFRKKLTDYSLGRPSAYLFNKAKTSETDPNAPTYFQRWILKAIDSTKPKSIPNADATNLSDTNHIEEDVGIDISRMFDEIELRPEIMAEHGNESESEYSLALADVKRINERMTHINIEAAKIFLNRTKDDLNEFAKKLLNDSMPGSYEKLINILKPKDPALDETEKTAQARQKLAYHFIAAARTCYCQKLQDINSAKNPLLGLEINLKSLSKRDIRNHREQKLTIFKSSDEVPSKYYLYGNTDGSSWKLQEIPESLLVEIDFARETKLPSSRRYDLLHGHIRSNRLHTLPLSIQEDNVKNAKSFKYFYENVISPAEALNRRPITSESFNFIENDEENEEQIYGRVQEKRIFAGNIKYLLEMQKSSLNDAEELQSVNASIRALEIIEQDAQAIDEYMNLELPVTDTMKTFLDKPISNAIKTSSKLALSSVIKDLKSFSEKTGKNRDLQHMIAAELEKLAVTEQSEIDYNLDFPFDSPIYLIMKLYSEYDNLTNLMDDLDMTGLSSKEADEYKMLILQQIKQILLIEEGLRRNPVDNRDIQRAHAILSNPIVSLSNKYASACISQSTEVKDDLIIKLGTYVERDKIRSDIVNLSHHLAHIGAESYINTIKEIDKYLHDYNEYSYETVQQISHENLIFQTAAKLREYNDLPESPSMKRQKLASEIQVNLQNIETWYENQNLVISARANLKILSAHLETLDQSYNKGKLRELISRAQESLRDENVRFYDSWRVLCLLNNDVIKLANVCGETKLPDEEKIAALNLALKNLGGNNSPKSSSFSFQAFKDLFNEKTRNIDPYDRENSQQNSDSPKNIKGM
jgi:hypothetical protein